MENTEKTADEETQRHRDAEIKEVFSLAFFVSLRLCASSSPVFSAASAASAASASP